MKIEWTELHDQSPPDNCPVVAAYVNVWTCDATYSNGVFRDAKGRVVRPTHWRLRITQPTEDQCQPK